MLAYGGVIIDAASIGGTSTHLFETRLRTSLTAWRAEGKKGIWLKVPAIRTELLTTAIQLGFELHHCEKEYVMCTYWIPGEEGVPSTLPGYTSHSVGVGAVVINDQNQILVVQEKSGPASGIGFWKYPTGD